MKLNQKSIVYLILVEAIRRKDFPTLKAIANRDKSMFFYCDEENHNSLDMAVKMGADAKLINFIKKVGVTTHKEIPSTLKRNSDIQQNLDDSQKISMFFEKYHLKNINDWQKHWPMTNVSKNLYNNIHEALQSPYFSQQPEKALLYLAEQELDCFIVKNRLNDLGFWQKQVRFFGGTQVKDKDSGNFYKVPHGIAKAYLIIHDDKLDKAEKMQQLRQIEISSNSRYHFFSPLWGRKEITQECYKEAAHLGSILKLKLR